MLGWTGIPGGSFRPMAFLFRRQVRRILFALLLASPLGGTAGWVQAQTFDATNLREPANLGMKWLVNAGDDPAYAHPDFDDSHWTIFDPYLPIGRVFPQHPGVIWYRLHVKVDPHSTGLALSEIQISRAFEVYVNGERLIVDGQVAPYRAFTSGAQLLGRIPDRLASAGSLVIAMRVGISAAEWTNGQDSGFYATNLVLGQY